MPNYSNVSALVTNIQLCSHYFLDHPRINDCIIMFRKTQKETGCGNLYLYVDVKYINDIENDIYEHFL